MHLEFTSEWFDTTKSEVTSIYGRSGDSGLTNSALYILREPDVMVHICLYKVGCIFRMVISSEFGMEQYKDDDHQQSALHFIFS